MFFCPAWLKTVNDFVCQSVFLSVCLYVCLSVCYMIDCYFLIKYINLSTCFIYIMKILIVFKYVCLSSFYCAWMSVCMNVCLTANLPDQMSIKLQKHISIFTQLFFKNVIWLVAPQSVCMFVCLLVCKYVGQSFSILVCTSFCQIVSIMFVLMCLEVGNSWNSSNTWKMFLKFSLLKMAQSLNIIESPVGLSVQLLVVISVNQSLFVYSHTFFTQFGMTNDTSILEIY